MTETIRGLRPPTVEPIRILLADDHVLIRVGVRSLLAAETQMILVAEATDADAIEYLCRQHQPHVLLLDMDLLGSATVGMIDLLRARFPATGILVLIARHEQAETGLHQLIAAGIAGCVLKQEALATLSGAIQAVAHGGFWLSHAVAQMLVQSRGSRPAPNKLATLTERELTVVRMIIASTTNREIGKQLGISEKAVEKNLGQIFAKLGVATRVEVAVQAVREGLV